MKKAGVPFGLSITVSRDNYLDVLSEEFLDYFFLELGAFYGFYFQYLPVGRNADFKLMPTPSQRFEFWKEIWNIIEKKKLFLLDFWNHGPLVKGCISAGRDGGYLHIDWNGKVMPCVFTPFSAGNINDIYKNGGTLNDLWKTPFLKSIRDWQKEYGHGSGNPIEKGNLLIPCPYRDHYRQFLKLIEEYGPEPEDQSAYECLQDLEYCKNMAAYDEELAKLFNPVWEQEYLKNHI